METVLIKVKEITPGQAFNKCMNVNKCSECDLNYKHWCLFKNTHEQIENNLGKKDYEKYLNMEIKL